MMHLKQLVEEQVQKIALLIQLACLFTNDERVKYHRMRDFRAASYLIPHQMVDRLTARVFR